jgi:hypothetical protein
VPRVVRAVTRAPRAAGSENRLCVTDALGNALASLPLIRDALLPALRRINTEEAR